MTTYSSVLQYYYYFEKIYLLFLIELHYRILLFSIKHQHESPQVHIYVSSNMSLPPICLPIPPLQVDTEPLFEFPGSYSKFSLALYFTYINVSFHISLFINFTLSSPILCPYICQLCLFLHCCPANKFISTIFLDSIHMLQHMIFIFLTYFTVYNRL